MQNLDWMVHVNIFDNETASFWKGPGLDPKKVKTECFLLPVTASVEKEGSQANSGRWMQWKYAAAEGPGDAISTGDVFWRVMSKLKELYAKDGGTFPEPILAANTDFVDGKGRYDPERVAKYINGYFLKMCIRDSYMNIVIHPHLCGRLCRLEMLRRFFRRTREDGDVLFATSAWLADYILERFPAEGPASA